MSKSFDYTVHDTPLVMKPKMYYLPDVYRDYVAKLLKDNPHYRGYWSKKRSISNFWIYNMQSYHSKAVEVINYDRWKHIMETYVIEARRRIVDGETLNLGHNLGRISARLIQRNFNNKGSHAVNWPATFAKPRFLGDDGVTMVVQKVFYTEDEYLRIGWDKNKMLTNETVYEFRPSRGRIGFKTQFTVANSENPMLKHRYRYYPYIKNANAIYKPRRNYREDTQGN